MNLQTSSVPWQLVARSTNIAVHACCRQRCMQGTSIRPQGVLDSDPFRNTAAVYSR